MDSQKSLNSLADWSSNEVHAPYTAPEAESKLRAIFDNCFQFVALLDNQGRLVEINKVSLEAAGVERSEVIGTYFWDSFFWTKMINPKYRDEFIGSWEKIREGNFVRFEVRGQLPSGEDRTVDFSVTPVMGENSQLCYAVAEARDVTSYKNLEIELLEKNRILSRVNAELEDFAILASHDLRQPLQSLSMNASILSRLLNKNVAPEISEQLMHMKTGVERMNLLLESILDYARSTKSSQEKTQLSSADIVREALDCLASSIEKVHLKVNRNTLPKIEGNRIQLLRVFQNLLSNAIKFQHPKRSCEIEVWAERRNAHWVFAVSDSGIGIDPKDLELIFRRFNQFKAKNSRMGLCAGLSICKDLVEQHGGKIWAESIPDEGSTFYFSLPAIDNP